VKHTFHPDFIKRYEGLFSEKEFSDFLQSCQTPLRKAIRINTLKISEKDFLKRAKANNWQLTKIAYVDQGYFIDRDDTSIPLWKSIEYFAGLFYIQETSSMIPPVLLKNLDKQSIILERKSEVKWSIEVIHDLAKLQKKLILSAIEALKVWGTLVYSTCTMTPEEDEAVLSYAKEALWDAIEIVSWTLPWLNSTTWVTHWQWSDYEKEVQNSQKIWPHINDTEGFFISKIIKKSPTNIYESLPYYQAKKDEVILKGKELKALYSQVSKRFWIDKNVFSDKHIVKKWNELEIRTKQAKQFSNYAMIQNMGIPLGTIIDNIFSFSFYAAQVFWEKASKNYIELQTPEEAENFRIWKDIKLTVHQCTESTPWQVIVRYDNIILGSSLLKKDLTLKNQVPRETIKI